MSAQWHLVSLFRDAAAIARKDTRASTVREVELVARAGLQWRNPYYSCRVALVGWTRACGASSCACEDKAIHERASSTRRPYECSSVYGIAGWAADAEKGGEMVRGWSADRKQSRWALSVDPGRGLLSRQACSRFGERAGDANRGVSRRGMLG